MNLIGILIFMVFTVVWYLPMFIKHRKITTEKKRYYLFMFLLGLAAVLISLIVQFGIGFIYSKILTSELLKNDIVKQIAGVLHVLIVVAVCEEFAKFFMGRIVVKKVPNLTEAGCMLLMGMIGISFGLYEEFGSSSIASGIINGVFEMHLFFQLFMGIYMWRAWNAKKNEDKSGYKKNMTLALVIPTVVHWVYDTLLLKAENLIETQLGIALIFELIAVVIGIVFLIVTIVSAYKVLKKEKENKTNELVKAEEVNEIELS